MRQHASNHLLRLLATILVAGCIAIAGAKQGGGIQLSADKTSLAGGSTLTLTVTLGHPAGPGGLTVPIFSSDPGTIPNLSCHFAQNQTGTKLTVVPNAVTTRENVSLLAGLSSTTSGVTVAVVPPSLSTVRVSAPNVHAGGFFAFITLLDGFATPGGITVNLTSSAPNVIALPSTGYIAAGLPYFLRFPTVNPVTQPTVVTFTASYNGVVKQCSVTVWP
ncbi:MAG TPA: hypothetical protein VKT78_14160 [Fimbriimonadaceae bacterium]|nr:hypothetical protein [Fimbriimonadaceae bacterium]